MESLSTPDLVSVQSVEQQGIVELTSGGGGKADPQCVRSRGGSGQNELKSPSWLKVLEMNFPVNLHNLCACVSIYEIKAGI